MLYLDHKKSHNHNPLSFNKILNPKEKQSQEYAPYRLIRGFSFGKNSDCLTLLVMGRSELPQRNSLISYDTKNGAASLLEAPLWCLQVFLHNIAKIKCREVILWCLGAADHLDGAVFF